jgi:hypothetical protein
VGANLGANQLVRSDPRHGLAPLLGFQTACWGQVSTG